MGKQASNSFIKAKALRVTGEGDGGGEAPPDYLIRSQKKPIGTRCKKAQGSPAQFSPARKPKKKYLEPSTTLGREQKEAATGKKIQGPSSRKDEDIRAYRGV